MVENGALLGFEKNWYHQKHILYHHPIAVRQILIIFLKILWARSINLKNLVENGALLGFSISNFFTFAKITTVRDV